VGGGVEYKFSPLWSVKVEYQYINFGKNDPCGYGTCFSSYAGYDPKDDDYHTVRLGINYHILPTYEPLK
jgi:outer membrane immunogenic protein